MPACHRRDLAVEFAHVRPLSLHRGPCRHAPRAHRLVGAIVWPSLTGRAEPGNPERFAGGPIAITAAGDSIVPPAHRRRPRSVITRMGRSASGGHALYMLRRRGDARGIGLSAFQAGHAVKERVQQHRNDRGQQDAGFQQRMQRVRRRRKKFGATIGIMPKPSRSRR